MLNQNSFSLLAKAFLGGPGSYHLNTPQKLQFRFALGALFEVLVQSRNPISNASVLSSLSYTILEHYHECDQGVLAKSGGLFESAPQRQNEPCVKDPVC